MVVPNMAAGRIDLQDVLLLVGGNDGVAGVLDDAAAALGDGGGACALPAHAPGQAGTAVAAAAIATVIGCDSCVSPAAEAPQSH
jgi:hypothetical protein